MSEKLCRKCGETKPLDQYSLNRNAPDGHQYWCRECMRVASRALKKAEWQRIAADPVAHEQRKAERRAKYRENPDKWFNANLRRLYGISLDQYNQMLSDQGGLCAICRSTCLSGKRLSTDHNALTGKVRELLCGNCNRGHGYYGEDLARMARAQVYLARHNGDREGLEEALRILQEALVAA